ncbi:glycosyltransferase [Microbacterium sp. M3]|uniref:Glycosyltransferase n=1 Tax=Microbacterium arthrosphaerae TaxID=792652 RepID=A0ABU4H8W5_9MICO|nr:MULTISPECIES: nucleotide disphospho-sugar-binding domain-containing protein [Microbacterium]MDW4574339.1 glycosyltransferase [Microbacterium arthrosphaerae]MDW7608194.1 glycosyltransferase [Microbacterium sp. M3]
MARFLLSAMPFTGHVTPLLAVAGALVERGHAVRFHTGAAFRARVEASGAVHVPWREAPDFDENDQGATFPRVQGRKGLRQVFINLEDLMIGTAPAQVADLQAEWDREPWDALAADEISVGAALFAARSGCAWATIAVLPLAVPSGQGPPSGMGIMPGRNPLTKTRDAALRALAPLMMRPLTGPLVRARTAVGLAPDPLTFAQTVFSPQRVLASGSPLLDYGRTDRPPHLDFVGVLTQPPSGPAPLPDWWGDLDGRTVVHLTQGTQNIDPSDLLRPALEALAHRNLLVVVSTGVRGRDELPFPVPGNARVAGFLPYDQLLPRTDVVITNGGWGGTLRALSHDIPLVIAGGDLDKPEVAARVAWSGAGVDLRTGTPTAAHVARGFERVSHDPSMRGAAARVGAQLRSEGGAQAAARLLEAFAREA